MEGLSLPGRLTPEDPKLEASRLGAFQSKVENSSAAGKIDGDQHSRKKKKDEEENLEGAVFLDIENDELSVSPPENDLNDVKYAKYTIKFNKYTEYVELIDIETGKVVQSMPPETLIELVSDLKYALGFFVDNDI